MPDNTRGLLRRASTPEITTAGATVLTDPQMTRSLWNYETWQAEAWDFWRNLGEFTSGIDWLKYSMSRVRLVAAEMVPGQKDPAFLTLDDVRGHKAGTAALALAQVFAGGTAGQAQIMGSGAVHLGVAGEGILVVERASEQIPLAFADWKILSKDTVRDTTINGVPWWEIRTGDSMWRPLADEALPTRIFEPDEQFPWRAFASSRPALKIMRTIDLLNRRIITTLVSRIAMNGLLVLPQEALVKIPEQYKGNPNWVVQKLIDAAMNNIRNPGSAGAALPQILDWPMEMIDKIKHFIVSDGVTKELLAEREAEIKRLAVTLTLPIEALLGYGDLNHWSAWLTNETGIKLYIAPKAETLVMGFTKGVMHPIIRTLGEEPIGPRGGMLCFWYDPSDLIARPDKSKESRELYDRRELSGKSMRAANGFDEDDKPDDAELEEQILKAMAKDTTNATVALESLTPWTPPESTTTPEAGANSKRPEDTPAIGGPAPASGTPSTQGNSRPQETSPTTASVGAAVRRQLGVPTETRELVGVANGHRSPRVT
jgi:hypothetical protein